MATPSIVTVHGDNAREGASGAPDALAQARELHDLAVVDEEVRGGALVLDVIGEDWGGGVSRCVRQLGT